MTTQKFNVFGDSNLKNIVIAVDGVTVPTGSTELGSFDYAMTADGNPDIVGQRKPMSSYVQDILYHKGVEDMSLVRITISQDKPTNVEPVETQTTKPTPDPTPETTNETNKPATTETTESNDSAKTE